MPNQVAALPFFADASKPWIILLTLNVLLFGLGTVMEAIAILLITVPMIVPIASAAGIDPIHLGVVMSFNLTIGLITPPMGSIMFVLCGIGTFPCRILRVTFGLLSWSWSRSYSSSPMCQALCFSCQTFCSGRDKPPRKEGGIR